MAKAEGYLSGGHYIDGHFVQGAGHDLISVNPADNTEVYTSKHATTAEVGAGFEAAKHTKSAWHAQGIHKRAQYLQAFAHYIEKHHQKLTNIISQETGKPLWEAATEVNAVIQKVHISIEAHKARTQDNLNTGVRYKPHGVVAVLGAFNFPAHLSNGHIIPALLAGNTIVYKPSEYTPLVAAFIAQAFHDIKLPHGVFNLVQGGPETAHALLDCDIQAVCFTGSYATGAAIHQALSHRPEVLLALEMGGNNPLVIDETLDNIHAAVYHTMVSAFITTGQRCSAARRLIIPDTSIGDDFLNQLLKATQRLRIGNPCDTPEPFMGPVISARLALKHINTQAHLLSLGAKPLCKMEQLDEHSAFLTPGIVDMQTVGRVFDEEIFAPCLQVYRYQHFDEAIALANQTQYGLVAALFGGHQARFEQFYEQVNAGLIHWNHPTTGASSMQPFGGIGKSGNHRPSAYFAADYVSYPVASQETSTLMMPEQTLPGLHMERTTP